VTLPLLPGRIGPNLPLMVTVSVWANSPGAHRPTLNIANDLMKTDFILCTNTLLAGPRAPAFSDDKSDFGLND
jgi:hypothetical protein